MSQILTRARRERRPPLAPDQAVRPLTDRGPASARRPPGRISIVIDSDSDYSDESTHRMEEETNALTSSLHECLTNMAYLLELTLASRGSNTSSSA
jgi:hypothetical protein